MIEILRQQNEKFIFCEKLEEGTWINISHPTRDELESLSLKLQVPLEFFLDSLDDDERSHIEYDEKLLLIVIRIPIQNEPQNKIPYTTLPIGILLTKQGTLITICKVNILKVLDIDFTKEKLSIPINHSRIVLKIFLTTSLLYLNRLKEINKLTSEVEEELEKSSQNKELILLLNIEKSLVFFTTSLRSNELVMERLLRTQLLDLNDSDKDLLEDVIIENKQAIEMVNIYSNILSGMMDAFASVINNNMNYVMKMLTAITIMLTIPTLISSIFGMNVEVPFEHSKYAFLIVSCITLLSVFLGLVFFRKKKWI